MQDEEGQILEAHSVSAGLDYPGSGPEHAHLRDSGRVRYVAMPDEAALDAFRTVAELEGILPALEPSHALAWLFANPAAGVHLVTLSGRGDKDLAEVLALGDAAAHASATAEADMAAGDAAPAAGGAPA
jgi:tryptophan synthase beta chain